MSVKIHPVHGYKISPSTGARLPSVNVLREKIAKTERQLEVLRAQLQEHLMEVSK